MSQQRRKDCYRGMRKIKPMVDQEQDSRRRHQASPTPLPISGSPQRVSHGDRKLRAEVLVPPAALPAETRPRRSERLPRRTCPRGGALGPGRSRLPRSLPPPSVVPRLRSPVWAAGPGGGGRREPSRRKGGAALRARHRSTMAELGAGGDGHRGGDGAVRSETGDRAAGIVGVPCARAGAGGLAPKSPGAGSPLPARAAAAQNNRPCAPRTRAPSARSPALRRRASAVRLSPAGVPAALERFTATFPQQVEASRGSRAASVFLTVKSKAKMKRSVGDVGWD
ncbi:hypothetical protein H8959_009831 [Pygathrix nigripes]